MAFELIEFREPVPVPGEPFRGTIETHLGTFDSEADAVSTGRRAWQAGRAEGTKDVMWWIVRVPGETLARWIADSASPTEQVLDLTTNTLVALTK